MFTEEVGFVLQISASELADLRRQAPGGCQVVAKLRSDERVVIRQDQSELFAGSRSDLQQQWAKTSYLMQRRRDSAVCADEEFAGIRASREENPGLNAKLTFDPSHVPSVLGASKQIAVLREQV